MVPAGAPGTPEVSPLERLLPAALWAICQPPHFLRECRIQLCLPVLVFKSWQLIGVFVRVRGAPGLLLLLAELSKSQTKKLRKQSWC